MESEASPVLTVPHSILLWPQVHDYLLRKGASSKGDLEALQHEGTSWIIRRELDPNNRSRSQLGLTLNENQEGVRSPGRGDATTFPDLPLHQMLQFTEAYFNTFNVSFPILCGSTFRRDVLDHVHRHGFSRGNPRSAIALFVFALGAVAIEGTSGHQTNMTAGVSSGVRGGSVGEPPGVNIFNEARLFLATMDVSQTLEKVQALLLQAFYFGSCACNVEFWHSVTAASMVCQVLVRCHDGNWSSPQGDMIKRAYWTCLVNEEFFHADLDLPKTTIATLQDKIPMPHFHEVRTESIPRDLPEKRRLGFHLSYFLALIALRRLIMRVHNLFQSYDRTIAGSKQKGLGLLQEFEQQLNEWRRTLPSNIQWSKPGAIGQSDPTHGQSDGQDSNAVPSYTDWTELHNPNPSVSGLGASPVDDGFNLDILSATLQSRYYYTRLLIHLPFIYKALHTPESMTSEDIDKCLVGVQSACAWPMAMPPLCNKKRLVPHLFSWTQNFIGVLLILRMMTDDPGFRALFDHRLSEDHVSQACAHMLRWIRDVRRIDSIADWGWRSLEPLFSPKEIDLYSPGGSM